MARQTHSQASSHPQTNGVGDSFQRTGDVPPTSTLAAQIVQNQNRHTTTQKPSSSQNVSFEQLLREILHNDAAPPETDVDVNVQLISVVAEAGLGPLTTNDPFARKDSLLRQASDSLAVIRATVSRQPEVLLTPVSSQGPPLFFPLVSRVLACCGKDAVGVLNWPEMLGSFVDALWKSTLLWRYADVVRTIYRECIDGKSSQNARRVDGC